MATEKQIESDVQPINKVEYLVKAWEVTVESQRHFDRIQMQIRSLGITVLTTVLGVAAVAYKEEIAELPRLLFAAGILAWLAFYMMDRFWFLQFLHGANENAKEIETQLQRDFGLSGFNLSHKITEKSDINIEKIRIIGRYKSKITADDRTDLFYWIVIIVLIAAAVYFA